MYVLGCVSSLIELYTTNLVDWNVIQPPEKVGIDLDLEGNTSSRCRN